MLLNATVQLSAPADPSQRHRLFLDELIEIVSECIRLAHHLELARIRAELARMKVDPGSPPAISAADEAQSAVAYDRRFRAVQQGILLARRLPEPIATIEQAVQRRSARRQILRALGDDLHEEWRGETAKILHGEVLDRLDGAEIEDAIANKPIEDIIQQIRRDLYLGAAPGTKRRTPKMSQSFMPGLRNLPCRLRHRGLPR